MSMGVIVVVMIVVAMFVVVMVVIVITVMIVTIVMMMAMIMRGMIMRRLRIRPALGIERRLDLDDARAQSLHHRLDDVIPADPQAFWHDLGRQMAVAEMPGDANQMQGIGAPDLDQGLGGRDHLDQPAVLQHQRVAAAQRDGVFQIEQEFQPARPRHRHPPPVPVVEIEHDGIGGRLRPAMLAEDLRRADHKTLQNFSTLPSLMISITVGAVFICEEYSRQTFMCGARPCALRSSRVSQRSTTTYRLGLFTLTWPS